MAKVNLRSVWTSLGVFVLVGTVACICLAGRKGEEQHEFIDVDKGDKTEITISEKTPNREIRLRKPGTKIKITASFTPSDTTNQGVEWTLSDGGEDYLSIDPKGLSCMVTKECNFADEYTLTCTSKKDPDISQSVTFISYNYISTMEVTSDTHDTYEAMQGGKEVTIHINLNSILKDEELDYDEPLDDDVTLYEFDFDEDFTALFDYESISGFTYSDNGEEGEDFQEYVEFKIKTADDILTQLESITSGVIKFCDVSATIEFNYIEPESIEFDCDDEILI